MAKRTGPIPPQAAAVEVPRATLDSYVGSYSVGGAAAVVTLGEDGLEMKLGGQPTVRLIPQSATDFSVDRVDARVVFNAAAEGPATSLTIHQGGRTIDAPRATATSD